MKPTILQRLIFIMLMLGALVLGLVLASGFLILAVLLIPVILIRFYLHKKSFEKSMAARRARSEAQGHEQNSNKSDRSDAGVVLEGELIKKDDSRR